MNLQTIFTTLLYFCRGEADSDDDDRSPRSEDNRSYSNPIRDDSDMKAKMSEMNEEKRTKLREIEVFVFFNLFYKLKYLSK